MRAWYDILGTDLVRREDEAGLRESLALVQALIDREVARGVPASRIVLVGFSQGCAMTLLAGLRHASGWPGWRACRATCRWPPPPPPSAARPTPTCRCSWPMAAATAWCRWPRGAAARDALQALGHAGGVARLPDGAFGVRRGGGRPQPLAAAGAGLSPMVGRQAELNPSGLETMASAPWTPTLAMTTIAKASPAPLRLTSFSHGGGCGCKIAPGVLAQILAKPGAGLLPKELLVGIETADDAAVYQINDSRRSSRPPTSSCPSSTIRSTSAASPRPTRSPTSTRWAARRCSRWRWSACRSTSCRSTPSAGSSRAASRSARGRHPDRRRPHHRLGRADLRAGRDRPRRTRSTLQAQRRRPAGRRAGAGQADRRRRLQRGAEEGAAVGAAGYAAMIATTTKLNTPGHRAGPRCPASTR